MSKLYQPIASGFFLPLTSSGAGRGGEPCPEKAILVPSVPLSRRHFPSFLQSQGLAPTSAKADLGGSPGSRLGVLWGRSTPRNALFSAHCCSHPISPSASSAGPNASSCLQPHTSPLSVMCPALAPHTAATPANVTHVVPAGPTQDSSKAEFCADPAGLPGDLLPPCPVAQLFFSL